MNKRCALLIGLLLVISCSASALAQTPCQENEDPALNQLPTLGAVHFVMAEMWHNFLPAGDYASIRQKAPKLLDAMKAFRNTQLPPALADRAEAINEKRAALDQAVQQFGKAAVGKDDAALKTALTDVHVRFHEVVEVVQSPKASLKEFHDILFVLMHEGYANRDFAVLKEHVAEFKAQADALVAQGLTPRSGQCPMKVKEESEALAAAVNRLSAAVAANDETTAWQALDEAHRQFMALAKVAQ